MDGNAFLNLALQLASSDKEERLRSSVSRAYYGAYHVARELVRSFDVIVPRRDVHDKLQWCLRQCGEKMAHTGVIEAASALGSLRTERNRADYDLADTKYAKQANAVLAIKAAQEIVDVLVAITAGPAKDLLHAHVRTFAQLQRWQLR